jgi:hypothetical protein
MLSILRLLGGLPDKPVVPYVSHVPSGIGRCTTLAKSMMTSEYAGQLCVTLIVRCGAL